MASHKQNMNDDDFWSFINGEDVKENPVETPVKKDKEDVKQDGKDSEKEKMKVSEGNHNKVNKLFENINAFDVSDPSDEEPLFGEEEQQDSDGSNGWLSKDGMKMPVAEEKLPELNLYQDQTARDDDGDTSDGEDGRLSILGSFGQTFQQFFNCYNISIICLLFMIFSKLALLFRPISA